MRRHCESPVKYQVARLSLLLTTVTHASLSYSTPPSRTHALTPSSIMGDSGWWYVEGRIPEQREVDGLLFPKVLFPSPALLRHDDPFTSFKEGEVRPWISEQVEKHGALLLRGFPGLHTSLNFNEFMEALDWPFMEYMGSAQRTKLHSRVSTANESSLDIEIHFHHEMSYSPFFPSKIVFFCEIEPQEGANTPILPSHKVVESVHARYPEFFRNLEEKGVIYVLKNNARNGAESYINGWEDFFGTTDPVEAERRASEYNMSLEWGPNRSVTMKQGPVPAIMTFKEHPKRKVWWNLIIAKYTQGQAYVTFGDGSPFSKEVIEGCRRIVEEQSMDIPWQQGDIMILDNLAVMHGRRVGKPPRKVLVSIAQPYDSTTVETVLFHK